MYTKYHVCRRMILFSTVPVNVRTVLFPESASNQNFQENPCHCPSTFNIEEAEDTSREHNHCKKQILISCADSSWEQLDRRYATALQDFLKAEFKSNVSISMERTTTRTGAFEVTVNGKLIHSKLTKGQGKCTTEEELDAILERVKEMM